MNRFVILEHDWPHLHWDLLLEFGEVLRSWRISDEPTLGKFHQAEAQPDHRKIYLNYEGSVSNGRGHVKRWDAGTMEWLQMASDVIVVRLNGDRLCGAATLQHSMGAAWTFTVSTSPRSVDPPPFP